MHNVLQRRHKCHVIFYKILVYNNIQQYFEYIVRYWSFATLI